jgi:hypothetical protein
LHSPFEKSLIIEKDYAIHQIQSQRMLFDDYFPYKKKKCKLKHVKQWLISFTGYYNREIIA